MTDVVKEVLFVCVHNSGRSRMAEAFFNAEMQRRGITNCRAISAGTAPASSADPTVVAVMAEVGLEIPDVPGRLLTDELSQNAIKFVSTGCGDADACPIRLRGDMEDWEVTDPKGRSLDEVREIREDVHRRVDTLIDRLGVLGTFTQSSRI